MKYEIDYEFKKKWEDYQERTEKPIPFPDGCTLDEEGLYVLPSGKYLPPGSYYSEDCSLIYEPIKLRCPWLFLDDDDN